MSYAKWFAHRSTSLRKQIISVVIVVTLAVSLGVATNGIGWRIRLTQTVPASRAQAVAQDPAVHGVNGYLQAHAAIAESAPPDAATQGTLGYLQAHAAVPQTVAQDPAVQGVNGYLQAHAAIAESAPTDAATQGIHGYLRAHGTLHR